MPVQDEPGASVTDETEDGLVARLLHRIFNLVWVALGAVVTFAFGAGVFFARTDARLASMETQMTRVTDIVVSGMENRLRAVEGMTGNVKDMRDQLGEQERRVRDLERKR